MAVKVELTCDLQKKYPDGTCKAMSCLLKCMRIHVRGIREGMTFLRLKKLILLHKPVFGCCMALLCITCTSIENAMYMYSYTFRYLISQ